MTTEEKIIKNKVGLLRLAESWGMSARRVEEEGWAIPQLSTANLKLSYFDL